MNILTIAVKEILQGLRDIKNFTLMIFMPTILILILSLVLRDEINPDMDMSKINIKFLSGENSIDSISKDILQNVLENKGFTTYNDSSLDDFEKDSDILIYESEGEIKVLYYKGIEVQGVIVSNIVRSIYSNNNQEGSIDAIEETNIYKSKNNSIINHYGIALITLTILFSSVTGSYSIIKERKNNTLGKILTMPVTMKQVILGKVLGALFISCIQIIIVIFISSKFLNINFYGKELEVIGILLLESSFAISFGILIGIIINDNKSCWIMLLSIIMISGLVGGAFIPLNSMNEYVVKYLSVFSPITYLNTCILNVIYLNNYRNINSLLATLIIAMAILLTISIKILGGKHEDISSSI